MDKNKNQCKIYETHPLAGMLKNTKGDLTLCEKKNLADSRFHLYMYVKKIFRQYFRSNIYCLLFGTQCCDTEIRYNAVEDRHFNQEKRKVISYF